MASGISSNPSRLQEKVDLQNLNERLAVYVNRVKFLESENRSLLNKHKVIRETTESEVSNTKSTYDLELATTRKLVDDTHSEKLRLEIDLKRLLDENDELKENLEKKNKELCLATNSNNILDTKYNDLQTKANIAIAEAKKSIKTLEQSEKDLKKMKILLGEARKQGEEATLARAQTENTQQSLTEELLFKEELYQQQVAEIHISNEDELRKIDTHLSEKYEAKLQVALEDLKSQYEFHLSKNLEKRRELYEEKIRNMQADIYSNEFAAGSAVEELKQVREDIDNSILKIKDLEHQNASLETKSKNVEALLEHERKNYENDASVLKEKLKKIEKKRKKLLKKHLDLLNLKVSLEEEIAAYSKILESEEGVDKTTSGEHPKILETNSSNTN